MRRLVAIVVFGVVALAAWPASAAGTTAVGWWTRSPIASAPEGGFTVGNAPDGPLSVAAVGVDLGKGVSSATLSFEQAGGSAPASPGQLVACVVGSVAATTAGPIEEAPATTCDGTSAAAAVNGTTWTVNLTDLVGDSKGTIGIALVPATGSTGVWDLQLDAPTFTSTAASGTGGTTGTTTASPFRSTATTAAPRPTTSPTFAVAKPPTVASPTATTAAPTTVAPTTTAVANLTAAGQSTFSGNAGTGESSGRPVGQAVSLVVLAALLGVAGGIGHKVLTSRGIAA